MKHHDKTIEKQPLPHRPQSTQSIRHQDKADEEQLPVKLMLVIALLQGVALLALHQIIEHKIGIYDQRHWLYGLYSLALIAPFMLLLSLHSDTNKKTWVGVALYTLMAFIVVFYVGWQAMPAEFVESSGLIFTLVITLAIATFKALMYLQHFRLNIPLSYHELFRRSWRNFLTLVLSAIFTLSVWAILMLWGALFKAIGITVFQRVFIESWFYYPTLTAACTFGVIIFRRQSHIIDTITRIQQALMKFLLVILVFVSNLFLLALPITGLTPLWESGGSHLILWMQSLLLFLLMPFIKMMPTAALILYGFIGLFMAVSRSYPFTVLLVFMDSACGWSNMDGVYLGAGQL